MDYLTYLRNFDYNAQGYNPMQCMQYGANAERNPSSTPWPLDFQSKSFQYLLSKAIAGIKESVADERHDELFYDFLISKAPTEEQKEIITGIRDDERIHNKIFRKVFTELSGVVMPANVENPADMSMDFPSMGYLDNLKKALHGEHSAIKKYRELAAYMPSKNLYDMVMYALTDEIRHADLYNYLILLALHNK